MKRSRFTEAQVIGILKEAEAGAKTADLARKHAVSEHTIYRWKAKYGGMGLTRFRRHLMKGGYDVSHEGRRGPEGPSGTSGVHC